MKLINRIFQRKNISFHLIVPLFIGFVSDTSDQLIFEILSIIAFLWFFMSAIFWIFSFLGKGDIRIDEIDGKVDKQSISIARFHNDALRLIFIISVIVGLFVLDFIEERNLSSFSFGYNLGKLLGFSLFFVFIYFIGRWKLKKNQGDKNRIRRGIIIWAILLIFIGLSLFSEKTKTAQLHEMSSRENSLLRWRNMGNIEGVRVTTERDKEQNQIELEKVKMENLQEEYLQGWEQRFLQTDRNSDYSEQIDNLYRNTKYNFRIEFPQGWDIKTDDNGINPNTLQVAINGTHVIEVSVREMLAKYKEESSTIKEINNLAEFKNLVLQGAKMTMSNVKLIDYGESKLDNKPAYWIKISVAYTFTELDTTKKMIFLMYHVLNNNIWYTITGSAPPDEFDIVEPEFIKSIETFVIEDSQN